MSFQDYSEILFDACTSCLGEGATYCPKKGNSYPISGVFTKEYMLIQEGSFDTPASSAEPVFEITSRDCSPNIGDRLKIRDELYRVAEIKPNSEGQIKLILKKGERL